MSTTHRDIVAEADAIIDAEFIRCDRRNGFALVAITLLLLFAAGSMFTGLSLRSPVLYAGGIAAFVVALFIAQRVPDTSMSTPMRSDDGNNAR